LTPYQFASNTPIKFIDLDGLEKAEPQAFKNAHTLLDYYENGISDGTICDETMVSGLSLSKLISDLRSDVSGPQHATCQNLGMFCGKSSLQSVLLNYNPMAYVSFITDLATQGSSRFGGTAPTTHLEPGLISKGLDLGEDWDPKSPTNSSGEIFGKSLDYSTSNRSLVRRVSSLFTDKLTEREGNTIPFEMQRMMRYVGMKPIQSQIYGKFNNKDLRRISNAIGNSLLPIVFENHGISAQAPDQGIQGVVGIHYIVMHRLATTASFANYTFGHYGTIERDNTLDKSKFKEGMKAYWIPVLSQPIK
jgi:hypothetical protein